MSINIQRISDLEESIKALLVKNPNMAQQIIDNVAERGKRAIGKQNPDLITATECLVVTKLLLDLGNRD
jgi:hypothetical protein